MSKLILRLIRFYQMVLAPLFLPSCRFAPSCSEFAREAVVKHGAARGSWLAIKRILRCHPWHPGGFDPVP
ncbi:MAG: membrane protein insertion efficiency factor YidD [Burkholderiales bacterium]